MASADDLVLRARFAASHRDGDVSVSTKGRNEVPAHVATKKILGSYIRKAKCLRGVAHPLSASIFRRTVRATSYNSQASKHDTAASTGTSSPSAPKNCQGRYSASQMVGSGLCRPDVHSKEHRHRANLGGSADDGGDVVCFCLVPQLVDCLSLTHDPSCALVTIKALTVTATANVLN